MANVYYSDKLGTNLNVFEKKTKGGEPFYYIYLNKTKITEGDVGGLTKIMQDTIPQATIKTKKGKIAYQVSWSYNSSTPLMSEQKIFDAMFSYLKGYGYVDVYQPKTTSKIKTTPTGTTTSTSNIDDDIAIPNKILKVGDEFYFKGKNYVINIFHPLYKITSISGDMLNLFWIDEVGSPHDLDGWTSKTQAQDLVADGSITFPTNQSAPTTTSEITSLQYYDLFSRVRDGKLFRVLGVEDVKDKNDVFYNIPDDKLVDLEAYDSIAQSFDVQHITFLALKNNIFRGELKYVGQVREGDSFVAENNFERFVTKVNDYPHDLDYKLSDLNFTPPRILSTNSEVKVGFTRSLINQGYKLNLRLGTPTTTPTPTPQSATSVTSKPQISNSEVNALKRELADLIFLKSGISDLDFEDKMNISSEIYDVQKKVDDLNEKLFEQSVGDEQFFDKLFEQSFTPLRDRYDLVITENNLNEILSPSGEISDLNEDLQVIVNSKEFKEWFGDWRNAFFYRNLPDFGSLNISKVLNDKFEPQLVWHGTNNEFSYFDFENFPANYFAVNKEYSEFFAINKGGRGLVLPFFLDIKNPLDLTTFGNKYVSTKDFFDWMYLMTGMSSEELDVNPMFLDSNMNPNPIWMYIRNNATMLQKIAQGRVYDGIKFYEFNPNEENNPDKKAYETLAYIIFDPHQAKLADPSRGEILLASLKSFMLKRGGKI